MNVLSTADRVRIIACLVEGNSQRAACRMTGAAKKTVARLALELGMACESFADRVMVELPRPPKLPQNENKYKIELTASRRCGKS